MKIKMSSLFLIRHAETFFTAPSIFMGNLDIPLSNEGVYHCIELANIHKDINIDIIFVSELVRTIETATIFLSFNTGCRHKSPIVTHNINVEDRESLRKLLDMGYIPIIKDHRLNERNYGIIQGKEKANVIEQFGPEIVSRWRSDFFACPPNGEPLYAVKKRTDAFFYSCIIPLLNSRKNIAIFAHQHCMRTLAMTIEEICIEDVTTTCFGYCEVIEYSFVNEKLNKVVRSDTIC